MSLEPVWGTPDALQKPPRQTYRFRHENNYFREAIEESLEIFTCDRATNKHGFSLDSFAYIFLPYLSQMTDGEMF